MFLYICLRENSTYKFNMHSQSVLSYLQMFRLNLRDSRSIGKLASPFALFAETSWSKCRRILVSGWYLLLHAPLVFGKFSSCRGWEMVGFVLIFIFEMNNKLEGIFSVSLLSSPPKITSVLSSKSPN